MAAIYGSGMVPESVLQFPSSSKQVLSIPPDNRTDLYIVLLYQFQYLPCSL
jgi:hypothetical protein